MVRRGPAPGSRDWQRMHRRRQREDRGSQRRRTGREQPAPKPFFFVAVRKDACPDRRPLDDKDLHHRVSSDPSQRSLN